MNKGHPLAYMLYLDLVSKLVSKRGSFRPISNPTMILHTVLSVFFFSLPSLIFHVIKMEEIISADL